MKQSIPNPTAEVRLRGLGLIAVNSSDGQFEKAFIRAGNHKLEMSIYGPKSETDATDTKHLAVTLPNVPGIEIRIEGAGNVVHEGVIPYHSSATRFNRLDPENSDLEDYRWIFNLSQELYGAKLARNPISIGKPPTTNVFVKNSKIFAVMPDKPSVGDTPFFMSRKSAEAPKAFGFIAETARCEVLADEFVVSVKIPGVPEYLFKRKHFDGETYRISLSNVDSSDTATPNESEILYKYLQHPDDEPIILEAWNRYDPESDGSPIHGKDYCHSCDGGGDNLGDYLW